MSQSPFLQFRRSAPGFTALLSGAVTSRELAQRIQVLHSQMKNHIARIIHVRSPNLDERTILIAAETCVHIVKAMLPLALEGSPKQRGVGERELKLVLQRYIAPLDGAGSK
jgi:Tetracyclin repressor-like, C-terminal domain